MSATHRHTTGRSIMVLRPIVWIVKGSGWNELSNTSGLKTIHSCSRCIAGTGPIQSCIRSIALGLDKFGMSFTVKAWITNRADNASFGYRTDQSPSRSIAWSLGHIPTEKYSQAQDDAFVWRWPFVWYSTISRTHDPSPWQCNNTSGLRYVALGLDGTWHWKIQSQADAFANPRSIARNTDDQSWGYSFVTVIVHLMLNDRVGEQDFKHGRLIASIRSIVCIELMIFFALPINTNSVLGVGRKMKSN